MPRVTFADCVEVFDVPSQTEEDRSSPWMQLAMDRAHFQSRILKVSEVIQPVIQKRQKILSDFHSRIEEAEERLGPLLQRRLPAGDQAATSAI